ncbi:MAG: hypothetical protein M2R45_05093 [Verrucomicrobia subdivision 3 bacterium]|nr:hypothetical protein [Limisphaerales bacterium]
MINCFNSHKYLEAVVQDIGLIASNSERPSRWDFQQRCTISLHHFKIRNVTPKDVSACHLVRLAEFDQSVKIHYSSVPEHSILHLKWNEPFAEICNDIHLKPFFAPPVGKPDAALIISGKYMLKKGRLNRTAQCVRVQTDSTPSTEHSVKSPHPLSKFWVSLAAPACRNQTDVVCKFRCVLSNNSIKRPTVGRFSCKLPQSSGKLSNLPPSCKQEIAKYLF